MATVQERLGIVETKVENLDQKITGVQDTISNNHHDIKEQLKVMYTASCQQHAELNKKIQDLESFKMKWVYMIAGGVAVFGILVGHVDTIKRIFY